MVTEFDPGCEKCIIFITVAGIRVGLMVFTTTAAATWGGGGRVG
jgi:hypothetical protein